MAHPMLAKSVLEYVLQIKKKTLSALTVDMLKSNLMKSTSRGRDDVFEIVHHMLNRRKVTDDEKQTNFSPLIESIIDGENSDKEKRYENAGKVLKEGLSLFINDSKFEKYAGTISQTLARLHSKWKHFDEAVEWAKKSLELAYKDNRWLFNISMVRSLNVLFLIWSAYSKTDFASIGWAILICFPPAVSLSSNTKSILRLMDNILSQLSPSFSSSEK
jgi:tetratricopeptide (TPR) repeat protein